MSNKKFWKWRNDAESGKRELVINGAIAEESWLDDDVTPELFKSELMKGSGDVTLWINSPGGDCIAASRIYAMLMDYKGNITVKIDGLAASAASVIAMAGNEVLMAPTAMMMIHNPLTLAYGNAEEMERTIKILDEVKQSIVNAYEIKTNLSRSRISKLMDDETWMNAKKAVELGFADGMLARESGEADTEDSYSFPRHRSEVEMINRLKDQRKPEGRRVDELMERLRLLEN